MDTMHTFEFKKLELNYLKVYRISWAIVLLAISIPPNIVLSVFFDYGWWLRILGFVLVWFTLFGLVFWYSIHWYHNYQYALESEGLKIHKGVFWRQQHMVPRNRVQHIDITTGPLERRFALSKLVVHTAGSRNASVTLPGILQTDANALRQELINTNQSEDTV